MKNKLNKLSPQFRHFLRVCSEVAAAKGLRVYLVGGVVRDLLMRKRVLDLDIAVEGGAIALAQDLAKRLGVKVVCHHNFGTSTLEYQGYKIDFATTRSESYSRLGALPDVEAASLAQDLLRRDFTINAMAISLNGDNYGQLIDNCGSRSDLRRKVIRILHEKSFLDDPTRILRAIRFEQRFGFRIEPVTKRLMRQALAQHIYQRVSLARLGAELIIICREEHPFPALKRADMLGGLAYIYPGFSLPRNQCALLNRIEKTLSCFQRKPMFCKVKSWLIYMAALLYLCPAKHLDELLTKFEIRRADRKVILSCKQGLEPIGGLSGKVSQLAAYQLCSQHSIEALLFFRAYYPSSKVRDHLDRYLNEQMHVYLAIKGQDLKRAGLIPQRAYSAILKQVLHAKIKGEIKGKRQELALAKKIAKSNLVGWI